MSPRTVNPSRTYNNEGRAAQARATRRRIVDAAHDLLLEHGYVATTIAAVAERAGVSVETVYKGFGTKAALTKHVYDVTLVGDDEPVPLADRPELRAIATEPDPRRKIDLYAGVARSLAERLGPLFAVLVGARGTDPELQSFADTIDGERLIGARIFVSHLAATGALRADLDADTARDIVWTLISPEVYLLFVERREWDVAAYERWLASTAAASLLDVSASPSPRRARSAGRRADAGDGAPRRRRPADSPGSPDGR